MSEPPLAYPDLDPAPIDAGPRATDAGPAPARRRQLAVYVFAHGGTWIAVQAPLLVSLPLRVEQIAPDHSAQALSLVLGLGGVVALGSPLYGRLSDRTLARAGRRAPWLVGGSLLGLLGALILAVAATVPVLVAGWCVVQLGVAVTLVSLVALLVEIVPAGRRGTVSGLLGVCPPLGAVAGAWIAQSLTGSTVLLFAVPAGIAACAVILFVVMVREPAHPASSRPPARALLAGLVIDVRRHTDFGWAWLSRFAFFLAVACVVGYQALYLRHGLGRRLADVPHLIAVATLFKTAAIIAASLVCGRLSDRLGRRKPFVLGAALLFAAGPLVIVLSGSYAGFVVGVAVVGLALGTYAPVDLALVVDVLPDRKSAAAKDLGILNLATTLPGSLAPAFAALLLGLGGGYAPLFVAASLFAVLAASAIAPIRGVR